MWNRSQKEQPVIQTLIFTLQIVRQLNFDRKSDVQIDKKRKLCGKFWSSAQFVRLTRKKTQWNKSPTKMSTFWSGFYFTGFFFWSVGQIVHWIKICHTTSVSCQFEHLTSGQNSAVLQSVMWKWGFVLQVVLFEIDFTFFTQIYMFCQLISWTNWVNSGKFMDNCWISCQVMADIENFYDDLIIINLY